MQPCHIQPWWIGLADAPPDDASALHALGLGFMAARTLHQVVDHGGSFRQASVFAASLMAARTRA